MGIQDSELLAAYAARRDAESFAELVRRHRDMVYSAALRVVGAREDAEDVTQECFLRLARNAASIERSVGVWLHRTALHASIDALRRRNSRATREREAAVMAEQRDQDEASWEEIRPELDRAIDKLPDGLREPLILYFLEGRDQATVGAALGVSVSAVSRRLKRAIAEVREHLKQAGVVVTGAALASVLATRCVQAAPAGVVAEVGKLALAGLRPAPSQAAVAGAKTLAGGVLATAKAKTACVLVAVTLAGVAVQQVVQRGPAVVQGAVAMGGPGTADRWASDQSARDATTTHPGTDEPQGEPVGEGRADTARAKRQSQGAPALGPPRVQKATPRRRDGQQERVKAMRSAGTVVSILTAVAAGAAAAQEPATADMTDPVFVVRAYADACEQGDVAAALALTDLDDDVRLRMAEVVAEVGQWTQGAVGEVGEWTRGVGGPPDWQAILSEVAFLPLGLPMAYTLQKGPVEGDTARVIATPTRPREQPFVLVRQEDGTWRIDLEESILAATQGRPSFAFARVEQERAPAAPDGRIDWRARERLRELTLHLLAYAREAGHFPAAETWMDDLEAYCLDPTVLDVSDALGPNYGIAMNAKIAGSPCPTDWQERRRIVALYASRDTSRNASGDPDAELAAMDVDALGLGACLASEEVVTFPPGVSVDEALLSLEYGDVSGRRVRTLVMALRQYARDHEGRLPPAESWCDDALLYVPPEQAGEPLLQCPAAPALECAWAMNKNLAGADIRTLRRHGDCVLLLPAEAGVRNEVRAVPEVVAEGRYLIAWGDGPGLAVTVGMLDGGVRVVLEGDPYPRPRMAGF